MSDPAEAPRRRRPQTIGGAAYLAMVGAVGVGLVLVAVGNWQTGLITMAMALLAGALVRAILPDKVAGMLKVRRKLIDVLVLWAIGGTLLAVVIALSQQQTT